MNRKPFPARRGLFSFALAGLTKRSLPWVEIHFDQTAVHNLGQHSSNCMSHDIFAYCDLKQLYHAHSFTKIIPLLLSKPTQHEVSGEALVAK